MPNVHQMLISKASRALILMHLASIYGYLHRSWWFHPGSRLFAIYNCWLILLCIKPWPRAMALSK